MIGERTLEGLEIRLRPRGGGRFVTALFLGFWLCGWAIGEGFALWILIQGAIALATGQPPEPGRVPLEWAPAIFMGLFLILWLTLWTFGGIAAIHAFLSATWASDRLLVAGGQLRATWARGPFRRTRSFDRDAIRGFSIAGRDRHLQVELSRERVALSSLGTLEERRAAVEELTAELAIAPSEVTTRAVPRPWEVLISPEGERVLVASVATRCAQARVASIVAMGLAALVFLTARKAIHEPVLLVPAAILFAFMAGAAAGALWLARGRWEWRIGSGQLLLRRRWGTEVRDVLEARRLVLDSSTDSDGDAWYELYALPAEAVPAPKGRRSVLSTLPANRRTIVRMMNDADTVRDLARWLASEANVEIEDRTTPAARAEQLAQLRDLLEQSGKVGRWAGKLVDRLSESSRKAG